MLIASVILAIFPAPKNPSDGLKCMVEDVMEDVLHMPLHF